MVIMKKYGLESTHYHVRQKVNSLRSNYRKDLRRLLDSRQIIDGTEVYAYKPISWKFYALRFLDSIELEDDEIIESETQEVIEDSYFEETSYDYNSSQEEQQAVEEDQFISDETHKTKIKFISAKKRKMKLENDCNTLEVLNNVSAIDKEYEVIGANVALKLKRMTEEQRIYAELLINKVLINGLKNNLTDDTDLSDLQVLDNKTFLEDYE